MSRHRNIRKLNVAEIFEEEYEYEEEYGNENFEMTLKHKEQMEEGKIKVKSIIGQVEGITDKDIEETLWYYYFDTEKTINWLLDKAHKAQARKQKQSQKQAVSNNSQDNKDPQSQGLSLSSLAQESLSHSSGRISLTKLVPNKSRTTDSSQSANLNTRISQKFISSDLNLPKTKLLTTSSNLSNSTYPLNQSLSNLNSIASISSNSNHAEHSSLKSSFGSQPLNFQKHTIPHFPTKDSANTPQLRAPSNPLIAPPSIFAIAIFAKLQDMQLPSNDLFTFELYATGSSNQEGFAFDEPSPDDIVLNAQSKKASNTSKSKKITTKPSTLPSSVHTMNNGTKKNIGASIKESDDDDIEILEEEYKENEQLKFDIGALSLDSEAKLSKTSVSNITTPIKEPENQGAVSLHLLSNEQKTPKTNIKFSKRIDVIEEYKKRVANKLPLNLVVIGHVDAGKSTLMGHLLYLLGEVNEKAMRQYERDSSKIGKSSFAYAWVLDETGEERNRGITMDIAIRKFETEHRRFTLLDAPGHRDFIPNMISGASQADVSILVVDATVGEFESGFEANGQTKEHALLIRSLGVQQLVVAVNKLDTVEWSKARYDEIIEKLGAFLSQAGFKKDKIAYIPCSGLTGENIIHRSPDILNWYSGETLIQQIDKFEPPTRLLENPFRLSVADFFKGGIGNVSGVTVTGRIESGTIQTGEEIAVIPGGELGVVKALTINEESSKWAAAGDSVMLTLTELDILQLKIGTILCPPSQPVPITSHFLARIVVFDVKIPITRGFPVILHRQSLNEPANIIKLVDIINKNTGEIVKKNPRHLPKSTTATVEIKLSNRPIPLETFKDNKELGRIMLRKGGETVAAGVVVDILSYGS
ncbi:P-loop containing nucleoside triphosphate hydrolase protein [Gigaspora margarita]|uniref:Elongation factor 1 alpha-like protein n=1 Tax=Gigaspora margarita TaxID=4874 RepID=A0A8H4A3Q5_GIGMA|nr:P-loop containing nucleoside triphosphate hydrolase protein [Gigaspora margarita]